MDVGKWSHSDLKVHLSYKAGLTKWPGLVSQWSYVAVEKPNGTSRGFTLISRIAPKNCRRLTMMRGKRVSRFLRYQSMAYTIRAITD